MELSGLHISVLGFSFPRKENKTSSGQHAIYTCIYIYNEEGLTYLGRMDRLSVFMSKKAHVERLLVG